LMQMVSSSASMICTFAWVSLHAPNVRVNGLLGPGAAAGRRKAAFALALALAPAARRPCARAALAFGLAPAARGRGVRAAALALPPARRGAAAVAAALAPAPRGRGVRAAALALPPARRRAAAAAASMVRIEQCATNNDREEVLMNMRKTLMANPADPAPRGALELSALGIVLLAPLEIRRRHGRHVVQILLTSLQFLIPRKNGNTIDIIFWFRSVPGEASRKAPTCGERSPKATVSARSPPCPFRCGHHLA
jgi:hypothetical protein